VTRDLYQVECLRDTRGPRAWFVERADAEGFAAQFGDAALITLVPSPEARLADLEDAHRARVRDLEGDVRDAQTSERWTDEENDRLKREAADMRRELEQLRAAAPALVAVGGAS
jgi:hypothetical protein